MSYIGNNPADIGVYAVQAETGNGVLTAFTLDRAATTASISISIDGVDQIPTTAYAVTVGTTLTFTSAPPNTSAISIRFLGDTVTFGEPSDASVTSAKIADGAIVNADVNASAAIATSKISGLAASATTDTTNAGNITSGTVATARLGSGTASSSTFLRGDQTYAAAGGGKIGQVVSDIKTDTFTSSSTSFVDITDLSVAITPSATTSKILVIWSLCCATNINHRYGARTTRYDAGTTTTTVIGEADSASNRKLGNAVGHSESTQDTEIMSFNFLDTPSSTAALTYKPQVLCEGSNPIYVNRTVIDSDATTHFRGTSSITVMEVLA